ncbi:neuronal acetylcholine receptor subunit beta-3-like [Physella acuta]|uniref:neuronal acetylcholine receptor subunit beta-3-like n=1 Tax=Physella acuta TaxID=109671 RepID=UPI0027DC076A|nr:neuronal acetylcholine receptor subunit beta-3-like [Physella acuta]
MRSVYRVLVLIGLAFPWPVATHQTDGPEHRLYLDLFAGYTAEARPVKNASHTVIVTFAMSLNQLLDLDEKNQVLTTSVWIYEEWKDEMLQWSPDQYQGQKAIMIPADSVWLPDIFIFNTASANMDGFVSVNGSKVSVKHDGTVRWMVPLMVASVCSVDVTYFPYDQQTCVIKFGSWVYDIEQVDIVIDSSLPDLEHYVMNSEYDLNNVSISRGVLDSTCCPGNGQHSMVELKIELHRKSLYYDYIVIAPTIMLCVLTLASFLLPCDRGEKMAIGLTVFLTLYVLQLRIADNVPDTNATPILGVFMLIVMTFNCVSLIMATIVMNIKKRGDDSTCPDVPTWLFALCHCAFGKVVCTSYFGDDQISCPLATHSNGQPKNTGLPKSTELPKNTALDASNSGTSLNSKESDTQHANNKTKTVHENSKSSNLVFTNQNNSSKTAKPPQKTSDAGLTDSLKRRLSSLPEQRCYDPHKTPHPQSESESEMKLRKSTSETSRGDQSDQNPSAQPTLQTDEDNIGNVYIRKRRWFYVAEVVDKFLFLVYLVLLTTSIFTVLYLIPRYFRR